MSADVLHPCPLCGDTRGYAIHDGSTYRWSSAVCPGCGEVVAEFRSAGGDKAAAEAWNEAGKYAAGLQSEIDRLTRELAEAKARAIPDGWVAVPVVAPPEVLSAMTNATWLTDGSHIEMARRWNGALSAVAEISARPDPKESSNVE